MKLLQVTVLKVLAMLHNDLNCLCISYFVQVLKLLIEAMSRSAQSFTHAIWSTTEFASWNEDVKQELRESCHEVWLNQKITTDFIYVMLHSSIVRRCDPCSVIIVATKCFFSSVLNFAKTRARFASSWLRYQYCLSMASIQVLLNPSSSNVLSLQSSCRSLNGASIAYVSLNYDPRRCSYWHCGLSHLSASCACAGDAAEVAAAKRENEK